MPEDRILAMLLLGGWAYETDTARAAAATREALSSWVEAGLGVRTGTDGGRCYDPAEVLNVLKAAGLAGRDGFWSQRYVATGRRLVRDLADAARFTVDFQRSFPRPREPRATLRLRAPLPLPGDGLEELDVTATVEGPGNISISPGRLEARVPAAGDGDIRLQARIGFTAWRHRPGRAADGLTAAAAALYLRPREGWIVVSDRVAALARFLAGPGTSPRAAVAAFWDHILDTLTLGAIHYDQVDSAAPCDWVLATGWFDCQLGSALLIALCRAVGLPARLVSGHVLYRKAPTNHYWSEIWFEDEGWTPFDLSSWDLSCGGRDPAWRGHFFGALDARMPTQRLPLDFTGAIGVAMPAAWHLLQSASADGVIIDLIDLDGNSIHRDQISVAVS